jgi:hypothetical protein
MFLLKINLCSSFTINEEIMIIFIFAIEESKVLNKSSINYFANLEKAFNSKRGTVQSQYKKRKILNNN